MAPRGASTDAFAAVDFPKAPIPKRGNGEVTKSGSWNCIKYLSYCVFSGDKPLDDWIELLTSAPFLAIFVEQAKLKTVADIRTREMPKVIESLQVTFNLDAGEIETVRGVHANLSAAMMKWGDTDDTIGEIRCWAAFLYHADKYLQQFDVKKDGTSPLAPATTCFDSANAYKSFNQLLADKKNMKLDPFPADLHEKWNKKRQLPDGLRDSKTSEHDEQPTERCNRLFILLRGLHQHLFTQKWATFIKDNRRKYRLKNEEIKPPPWWSKVPIQYCPLSDVHAGLGTMLGPSPKVKHVKCALDAAGVTIKDVKARETMGGDWQDNDDPFRISIPVETPRLWQDFTDWRDDLRTQLNFQELDVDFSNMIAFVMGANEKPISKLHIYSTTEADVREDSATLWDLLDTDGTQTVIFIYNLRFDVCPRQEFTGVPRDVAALAINQEAIVSYE